MDKCPACYKRSLQSGTSSGLPVVYCHLCGYRGAALELEAVPSGTKLGKATRRPRARTIDGKVIPKRQTRYCPTEGQEQEAYFALVDRYAPEYPELRMIYAVPNGADKTPAMRVKFKREGLRRGVPDINVDVAREGYHGLRIELKRLFEGDPSEDQLLWIDRLNAEGYLALVCRGCDSAWKVTIQYLGIDPGGILAALEREGRKDETNGGTR